MQVLISAGPTEVNRTTPYERGIIILLLCIEQTTLQTYHFSFEIVVYSIVIYLKPNLSSATKSTTKLTELDAAKLVQTNTF